MKAVIVCGFDTYEARIQLVKTYLEKKEFEVSFILSNFKHSTKEFTEITQNESSITFVNT